LDFDTVTDREVQIAGYGNDKTKNDQVPIDTGITAVGLPSGETILIREHEATILGEQANTLFSTIQMRENGVVIDEKARRHGGMASVCVEDCVIPLTLMESMLTMQIRRPTENELHNCDMIDLTADSPWHPDTINEKEISGDDYEKLIAETEERMINMKTSVIKPDIKKYEAFFLYPGEKVMSMTLQNTTRYGSINFRIPMRQHCKSRNSILQR
jgi:hypothetical protein